ncbi:MAG: acyl-CoA thioesterase [Bacteroidota bacterium]
MNKNPNSQYKIRFTDCDMLGHLNNARYIDYLINAREDHLKTHYNLDLMEYYMKGVAWVIRSHEIIYSRPAMYNEMVEISSSLRYVDNELLHLETVMQNEKRDHVKAIMWSRLVPVNSMTGRKIQHDAAFLNLVQGLVSNGAAMKGSLQDRIDQLQVEHNRKDA